MKAELEQDAQLERRRQLAELDADGGPGWREEFKPGSAGCHELLDRVALFSDMVDRHILAHPACVGQAEWYLRAERAAAALRDLYQAIGAEHLGQPEPNRESNGKRKRGGEAPSLASRKARR